MMNTVPMILAPRQRWRSYALETRCELLRALREPAYLVPVIGFPPLFYLLFGVLMNGGGPAAAEYLLATFGCFGVIGVAMFGFGVSLAMDREYGMLRLKRVQPVPPGALLLSRTVMAILFAIVVSLILASLAISLGGVRLAVWQWLGLIGINVLGVLPFAAIGLYLGSIFSGSAAPAAMNAIYLPMAFLSGLWLPLSLLPSWLAHWAPIWPSYHLSQLALKVLGRDQGGVIGLHVLVLLVFTLGFYLLAQRRLGAAQ